MHRFIFILWLLIASAGQAAAGGIADAHALIRAGNPASALDRLAGVQPANRAENLRLLWLRSVALMRLNRPAEAIAHLGRLVALDPGRPEFRLELATALALVGQSERALYHIDLARAANLPPKVDARAADLARRLESPKLFSGHFSFAIVPESNPARRTSATELTLAGLTFRLNPNARAKPATGLEFRTGIVMSPQIADGWRAQIGVSTQIKAYGGRAPDDYSARVFVGLETGHLETGYWRGQLFGTRRWLDKRYYSRSLGAQLTYTRRLTAATRLDISALHERQTFRSGASMTRNFAAFSASHAFSAQLGVSFGARVEDRSSQSVSLGGRLLGATLGADYRFKGGIQAALTLDMGRNKYDGLHPLFGIARVDQFGSAKLELSNSQWNWRGFAPVLRVGYEHQTSTIVLNRFTSFSASFGATRRF